MRRQSITTFMAKVDVSDNCWIWTAGRDRDGYGLCRLNGHQRRAHCVIWELIRGPIPPDLCICHTCDNPPCVRLAHLFMDTRAGNNRDRDAKGRTGRMYGETNHRAKLTEQQVRDIRLLRKDGLTLASLAQKFGISITTVHGIVHRREWSHIQ